MSLYSDDPTEQDPYQALTVALAKPAETVDQVKALQVVSDLLEQQPAAVQTICLPLFEHIKNTGDTVLKRWVLERIAFGVGRSSLHMETKTASKYEAVEVGIRETLFCIAIRAICISALGKLQHSHPNCFVSPDCSRVDSPLRYGTTASRSFACDR
jgi:hypothetical protein